MKQSGTDEVPSTSVPPASSSPHHAVSELSASSAASAGIAEELTTAANGISNETVVVDRRGQHSSMCKWTVQNFPRVKARAVWSKYFEVGGYDCRLLVYPKGDSQALPGYVSIYLQIIDPRGTPSSKWDCFASYRLSIVNITDESKTIHRDSWHRFSTKKKSHGWCDFTSSSSVLDQRLGYLSTTDSVLITADILILNESVSFTRDNCDNSQQQHASTSLTPSSTLVSCSSPSTASSLSLHSSVSSSSITSSAAPIDVLSGKFTWKVHNFSLFKEMIKTQKIMSPVFPAGECNLRISVYQSCVNGQDYLSMCLESKDTDKPTVASGNAPISDRSCWCLFRMSVLNQKPGLSHTHRDSYGRFATDNKSGDNTSLGWNDYMKMSDFMGDESGFLVDDTAVFSTSFHVIKEFSSFSKNAASIGGRISGNWSNKKSDGHTGKFTWRIENFTRLKDLLKKRKITGLCIKSRRFQIGNRDCRLIVYPRGQSQPPCHLSVFLEVTDSRNLSSDWSCFVSHRLSVVNQRAEEKSVVKESQNRYSKAAKDWGWREFVTLTNLFGQDSGFLFQDTVIFSAEVLILKETSIMQDTFYPDNENNGKKCSFTWKVENFLSFKEIMETRKIFSKFFQAGGCELRIGVYESFDTVCIYLESDQSSGTDPDKNFWVRYRIAVVNQKNQSRTVWKESSICTKTWNNSVLQFMKVSDLMEADAGFLVRDCVVFVCEILDCCPWFEFSDLEVLASEDDQDALTADPDELIDSEDSEGISVDEEDIFRNLLSRAGFHLTYGDNPSQPLVTLREKLLMDAGAIAGFLTGLRVYLDDPVKVKRLLLPTKVSGMSDERTPLKTDDSSPCLMNLLMGVKVLQQAIVDLLLDIMVECCQQSDELLDFGSKLSLDDTSEFPVCERFDCAVQSSSSHAPTDHASFRSKTKWPEQSEELLGLIVNSLRALDGAVPHGCPEPRRGPQSAQKIALVLDKAPNYLHSDLISLVPKLVDQSEHSLAAHDLLHRLRKPDAEPSLRFPVFGVVTQLECGSDVWERILFQSFDLLNDSNDEPLAATIEFVFKGASLCQHLPEAVRAIRERLKVLGHEVSTCVLNFLCKTLSAWGDVAETFLRDVEADDDFEEGASEERSAPGRRHFSDIYLLLEMLSIPCLSVEVSRMFEISVGRGVFSAQTVAMVLERRLVRNGCTSSEMCDHIGVPTDDFPLVLGLAESLSLSGDSIVKGFVKLLYSILFKCYPAENHREQILRRLVNRTVSTSEDNYDANFYVDVLAVLVFEEQEIVHRVFCLMREVAELANVDRAAIWHQLCACEDEIIRLREDTKSEAANSAQERSVLAQKLNESEASNIRLKSEMKAESDRFAREKKVLVDRISEVESQVEWARSEREDEMAKLKSENRALHDRLHEAESQLFQLKSRKRDEMKRVVKERNALAERLKSAEAARKRFDEELKRLATENVSREEVRQSLEDEIKRLTKTVGQTEEEKREKEEQVARCEAYIDGMDSKLLTCQEYIHSLETSLQEEMTRHAPLYGAGLEALSMSELDTISRIHEEGIRQIHALKLRMASPPHNHSLYPPSSIPVGLPSQVSNGASIHKNGQVNGPWFNHP